MEKSGFSIRVNILDMLAKGPADQMHLRNFVTSEGAYTVQGFYKALKQLRDEEIITVHNGTVSLSFFWIQSELDRISRIASVYRAPVYQGYFGALKDGEKISYRFKTLRELEIFWAHALLLTIESVAERTRFISLTPHDWFQTLRPDINSRWKQVTAGRPHWAILTHATADEMRKTHYSDVKRFERMANVNPLHQKESVYINIIGDLVFEARFDEKIISKIRRAMEAQGSNPETILDAHGIYRLSITRKPEKAAMVEHKLKKYFATPFNSTPSLK